MFTVEELNHIVRETVETLKLEDDPQNLYLPIKHILSNGGKRIRPMLTLAACNLFSDNIDAAINPAIAVEVFHNFTLVHDDIMDNADIRRGVVTVHKKWNNNTAILSGDAMMVLAYELLAKTSPNFLPQVLAAFNELALGVCKGQQYDMDFELMPCISRHEYLKMTELKTSVLLKGALKIGAIIGGANSDDIECLGEYGINLGIAFQLQDDLLDAYGNTSLFGKKIGGDIMAQKKTILTIETQALLNVKERAEFDKIMQDTALVPIEKVPQIIKFYDKVNAKRVVEKMIDSYFIRANRALNKLKIPTEKKELLMAFTAQIVDRKY